MKNVSIENLLFIYDNLCKNIKNKKKLFKIEQFKMLYVNCAYNILKSNNYSGGKYNIFIIKNPKYRVVMSLNVVDKVINHFLCRYVLEPKLSHRLDIRNIATRKGLGTDYGIKVVKKYIEKMKKYDKFYILKIDISKYFYNIDHDVLKSLIKPYLDNDEYLYICSVIDSTNQKYINETIVKLKNHELSYNVKRREEIENIPLYAYKKGLPIGNLTSQFLAIYYLNELDHYIIHDLKLPKYIRYMDDFIIMSEDKEKLKEALAKIEEVLNNKYKLKLNRKKTKLIKSSNGFTFLGYRFRVINRKTIITLCSSTKNRIKKKVKENKYLYKNGYINFEKVFSSVNTYLYGFKYGSKLWVKRIIDNYFFN